MSQILGVGDGKYLTFDSCWTDQGDDAQYALIGNQKVLIKAQRRAKPQIFTRGEGFYYRDGTPVTDKEHVSFLPDKYRLQAEKWIDAQATTAEPLAPVDTKEAAVEQVVKRGRGRPKKVEPQPKLEIKDAATLKALGGDDI